MSIDHAVPMIQMAGVSKTFGNGHPAVAEVDLNIEKGEFVSLIGPSGCGKSTLLKLITGLILPSNGDIRVDGLTPKSARETISFIFQDPTLLPWRNVLQNVSLGLDLEGVPRDRRLTKARELLALVGLEKVARAYPRELSGGMRMRVSIARALATNPRLLLMDEPFAALDEMTRDRLNEELLRIRADRKWTAVFVTHSVSEAVFLSTRIIVLASNPGRVHASIPVELALPRTADLRSTPEYEHLVEAVSKELREANSV